MHSIDYVDMARYLFRQQYLGGGALTKALRLDGEGMGLDGRWDDRLQAMNEQAVVNNTYGADLNAFLFRQKVYDGDSKDNRKKRYDLGSADCFGLRPHELAFVDPRGQLSENDERDSMGSITYIKTFVHTVFNGLRKNDGAIVFRGVVVSGRDGVKDNVATNQKVSVRSAGTATIRNNGPSRIHAGQKLFWDYPPTDDRGKPVYQTSADRESGLTRFLPVIVAADCADAAAIKLAVLLAVRDYVDTVATPGNEAEATAFLSTIKQQFSLSSPDKKGDLTNDPIVQYAAITMDSITEASACNFAYEDEDATGMPHRSSRNHNVTDLAVARQRAPKARALAAVVGGATLDDRFYLEIARTQISCRIDALIQQRFIGTADDAAEPGASLHITVNQ